ncbi:puromycin-sensitive aminopeptidase-like protein, partial [Leptotrombidium deliense]
MPSCPQSTEKKPFERLPKTVVPHVYHLCLKPDLEKFTFDGTVKIDVTVAEPTHQILLNAFDLKISSASFSRNGTETKAKEWNINKDTEVATVVFPNQLEIGNGELSFVFTGNLNDKLHGFYRSQYKTPSGEVRYAATTQFESSHARQAFP